MTVGERSRVHGFGFTPDESPYHFAVLVRKASETVAVEERFEFGEADKGADPARSRTTKAILTAYVWSRMADPAKADFNRRLSAAGERTGKWSERETLVAPHFGKELTLLAWAVEDADPTVIPNMVANWLGLAPEERWWLFTTVNATSGHPEHGRDKGWRKAIKIALAENPSMSATPGTFTISEADAKRPTRLTRRENGRRSASTSNDPAQLTLLGDERL